MRPERPRPRCSAPGPMEAPPWDPLRNDSLPPTLTPAVPPYVKLGLTIVYTVFYSLLFVFIYVQLWLVLRYRHKRLSYQSVFLFLCLFWASLRTVLFSFYFKDFVAANALSPFVFWLLYCFPVCLQFFTLTLMNLYFTQVIFKAKSKYSPELLKYRLPLYLASLFISLVFLLVNLTCAVLVKTGNWERKVIVSVRVAINDTLFVLCAVSLSICLYKISKMSLANIYLESKGSSVCQVTAIGVTVILLYASRACYNLFILSFSQSKNVHSFDYDWYNVSDQTNPGMVPSHGFSPRSYFFDNPRRYDSDDDLAWNIAPQGLQGRLQPAEGSIIRRVICPTTLRRRSDFTHFSWDLRRPWTVWTGTAPQHGHTLIKVPPKLSSAKASLQVLQSSPDMEKH
ncbi:integral membrane protein GPR137B isoform X3 [Panthera pardus]|uniref:Integral membrane protein GPR137B isoform X3 n=1 Tax=Panthera pardus TaxID=9691 RepID=A0A9V1E5D9_PANPR|nr:integral membrane protein GPR137B isoform X3 [Panthera pardus]